MSETFKFFPPRRAGVAFHLIAIALFLGAGTWGLFQTAYRGIGQTFVFYLLPVLIALPTVPLLLYRLSNLLNASYVLERDGLHLQWGLRVEVIPTNDLLWARPASDVLETLKLPWLRWPGSVLGTRRLAGGPPVEFLASRSRELILVATYDRVYAISPADPEAFLQAYQHLMELGSLLPPKPQSVRPTFVLNRIWKNPVARLSLLASVILSLALLLWASVAAPSLPEVSLGFTPAGKPREPIPGVRIMLLPIINIIFLVFNFTFGIVLFRWEKRRILAILLWLNNAVVAALFLAGLYFIIRAS